MTLFYISAAKAYPVM